MIQVPTFTKGEPGFAAKLNQLGEAVRELQEAQAKPSVVRKPKAVDGGA